MGKNSYISSFKKLPKAATLALAIIILLECNSNFLLQAVAHNHRWQEYLKKFDHAFFLQEYKNRLSLKQKSTYRIMCLGESTTQDQYPRFLEEILNQRNTGIKFSVIDKGLRATNTTDILSQLEHNLDAYKPSMVVTMIGINDTALLGPWVVVLERPVFSKSLQTYKFLNLLWLHIISKAKEIEGYKHKNDQPFVREPLQKELAVTDPKFIPTNDLGYARLGWIYKEQNRVDEAEQAFRKAVELNPKNEEGFMGLGLIYNDTGKISQAEQAFKKALELNPKNDTAYTGLGWAYKYRGNRLTEAEQLFKKSLKLNPNNDLAYVGLGWIYSDQNLINEAEQAFKKALELNPKDDTTYEALGGIYRDEGRYSEAEQAFKKSLEIKPNSDRAYSALETIYFLEGKENQLLKEYNKETKQKPAGRYRALTISNYLKLKQILDKRNVRFVCVQYPMRSIAPLERIFEDQKGIVFVDNEKIFRDAVKKWGYRAYFKDMSAVDFGHCTDKGNSLLAENIANAILKEMFKK